MDQMVQDILDCFNKNSKPAIEFMDEFDVDNYIYGNYINQDSRILNCNMISDEYDILSFEIDKYLLEDLESIFEENNKDWERYENPLIASSFIFEIDKFLSLSHQRPDKEFVFVSKMVRYEKVKNSMLSLFENNSYDLSTFLSENSIESGSLKFDVPIIHSTKTRETSGLVDFVFSDDIKSGLLSMIGVDRIYAVDKILNYYGLNYMLEIIDEIDIKESTISTNCNFIFLRRVSRFYI